ncbi:conserved hypothetical protein [Alteracholeplasma palmae J233]|uniref:Transcriptional regulator, TetR family n=1 Tax=Alteracholeplasma palmae (strain ATCC 49389 / J233) TaxID=1318466 RepID=U4KLL0_ALTPJ|nr:TetR/AcrR family transcriptional regulator [Alteracholeplasma palmae]CCV64748.1 conserved hypothetical protein [Alteracholeplasma palmae J233]
MPPKAKFTKNQITDTALEILRSQGIEYLTARALGKALGSSSRPIFTVFQSMEELKDVLIERIKIIYHEYIQEGLNDPLPFKGVGMSYVKFAKEEPNYFNILFATCREDIPNVEYILPMIDDNYEAIINSIKASYQLSDLLSIKLYRHLWIYTHGIATLCASKLYLFNEEEVSQMITEIAKSLLRAMKEGKIQ